MAFPQTPLGALVELQLGGTWTDITTKVYVRSPIKIKRGRSSEANNVEPSTCDLVLDNRDGRFSPRNPTGPYYGLIGRNTPLRVSVTGLDQNSLQPGTGAPTTVSAAGATTSDLDIRVEVTPVDWWRSANVIGKWDFATGLQSSWLLTTGADGRPTLFLSTTGADFPSVTATVAVPRTAGRRFALRVAFTAATGTGTFYYADSIAGPWYQLGDPVTRGATPIFAGTALLTVRPGTPFVGRVYKAEVRTGAGAATLSASPDFTAQTTGATSFTDSAGRLWTVPAAAISSANQRFVGEVSSWPVRWDESGKDVYATVTAAGVLRRLLANVPPLQSTLRRSIPQLPALRAYWPCEDASGASSLASPLRGVAPATISGAPALASFAGFNSSDPLPYWQNGSSARGKVPSYASTGKVQLRFLLNIPTTGQPTDGTNLALLDTAGTRWRFIYKLPNNLQVQCIDLTTGTVAYTGPSTGFALDGKLLKCSLELTQNGANVDLAFATLVPGASTGSVATATAPGVTLGSAVAVTWGTPGSTNSQTAIGHVTIESDVTSLFAQGVQLNAYVGELADARASRLATEEGYALTLAGPAATAMGPQRSLTLIDLLRECQDADLGILGDARGALGLVLRSRASMYDQGPALSLAYGSGLVSDLQPTEDDQLVTNDVLLTRLLGSSVEVSTTSGPLSTAAPPNGIGKYQESRTLSLAADTQLRDQAYYRLALGTVDSPRYPSVGVQLETFASLALTRAAMDLDLGDLLQVTSPPGFYSPSDIVQRVEGSTEVLEPFAYTITWNTSPGDIWANTARYTDPQAPARYDSPDSTLTAGVTAGATAISVASSELWTTTPAHWPFQVLVAGELMTVTNVAGAASPQTLTVTRAVNGVSKAQLAGAAVHVYPVSYYAL